MYLPVLLRHSLVHWWEHFFSDIKILVLINTSGVCWCKQQSIVVVFTQNRCAGQTPLFTINRFLMQIHHLIMNGWLQINVWWIHVGSYLFLGHVCFWWGLQSWNCSYLL
jgi:hypothetical protein